MERMASGSLYIPASSLADRAASLSLSGAGVKRGSIYTVKKGGKRCYMWGVQKSTLIK